MAGLGFKDFQVGEVLTSADVDGYLMQQSVMRFADSAARGSALGTAVGTGVPLAEGMVAYLDDTNLLEVYDGTEWLPTGRVLQVVSFNTDTQTSTSSSTDVDTAITLNITPTSSSSKVLVMVSIENVACDTGTASNLFLTLFRGATALDSVIRKIGAFDAGQDSGGASMVYLDSPATTSATTYKIRQRRSGTAATTYCRGEQNITLVEIKA